jgi:Ni/Fe-hydrogenase subunit HybB-like protein
MNGERHMARPQYKQVTPRKVVMSRPRKKARFKWGIVIVPAVLLLAYWVGANIAVGVSWNSVMGALHVHNRQRYTQLACLGLVCVAVVAIARILRKKKDDSGAP